MAHVKRVRKSESSEPHNILKISLLCQVSLFIQGKPDAVQSQSAGQLGCRHAKSWRRAVDSLPDTRRPTFDDALPPSAGKEPAPPAADGPVARDPRCCAGQELPFHHPAVRAPPHAGQQLCSFQVQVPKAVRLTTLSAAAQASAPDPQQAAQSRREDRLQSPRQCRGGARRRRQDSWRELPQAEAGPRCDARCAAARATGCRRFGSADPSSRCTDASAQMALLQFSTCDRPTTAVPTSIHCDHLISAFSGAEADLKVRRRGRPTS